VTGQVSFATVNVNAAALQQSAGLSADELLFERFAFQDPHVVSCVESFLREARVPGRCSQRLLTAVIQALLLHVLRHVAADPQSNIIDTAVGDVRLLELRSRIDSDLGRDLSVDKLAFEAGLSRAHFARSFRQAVGESPHAYVMRRRIECSQRLLVESDLSLSKIAQETGFCSQSHFNYVFKARIGITPQQYRRQI
jgi:AraC family transcriptional regulator